ncbi:retrotransposon protein, putative, ty3-gypsy subclass [Tanacetum coccineum]
MFYDFKTGEGYAKSFPSANFGELVGISGSPLFQQKEDLIWIRAKVRLSPNGKETMSVRKVRSFLGLAGALTGCREIWAIIKIIDQQTEFRVDDDGILWQGTKLCVPEDPTLREALMTEAYSSPFSIHPGLPKMYHDLKQHFWCEMVKMNTNVHAGIATVRVPVWEVRTVLSMDFVIRDPRTPQRKHDAIWVVVDRLTKSAHFLPIRKDYPVSKLAEMFQQEIVRFTRGTSIMRSYQDRDPRFKYRSGKVYRSLGTSGVLRDNNSWAMRALNALLSRCCMVGSVVLLFVGIRYAADIAERGLEFQPGRNLFFLKLSPFTWSQTFWVSRAALVLFLRSVEILDRVGEVSYRLALPPQLSHVHNVFHVSLLRGYKYHPLHVVSYPFDQIREDLSYTEEPESILDRQDRVMRNKTILFVKILWRNHPEREAYLGGPRGLIRIIILIFFHDLVFVHKLLQALPLFSKRRSIVNACVVSMWAYTVSCQELALMSQAIGGSWSQDHYRRCLPSDG